MARRPGLRARAEGLARRASDFPRKAASRLLKATVGRPLVSRAGVFDFAGLLSRQQTGWVRDILAQDEMYTGDLLDPLTLRRSVERLLGGDNGVLYPLTCLMGIELWARKIARVTDVSPGW